jgi:hypothetical protein
MERFTSKIIIACGAVICFLNFNSCNDQNESNSLASQLETAIYEYVEDVDDSFRGEIFIIRVRKEDVFIRDEISKIYRFAAENAYLPENIEPDSIGSVAGKSVIFFLNKHLGSREREEIKRELETLGLINGNKAYATKSNYEERIVFLDRTGKFRVLKDTKYARIEEIAKLMFSQ